MHFKTTKLQPFGLLIEPENPENKSIHDLDNLALKALLDSEHLIVLRGFDTFTEAEEFSDYCETFGEICLWPFGKVLELVEKENPEDHIFDNSYMPLHWDGMYREQVPETQIFHCLNAPGTDHGGGTTFVNTKLALANVSEDIRDLWGKATCTYSRKSEHYDSKTVAPILSKHPEKGFSVIRYCEPTRSEGESFINHAGFELTGIPLEDAENFIVNLNKELYSPENLYIHRWISGDIVFSDNHTLLHGRESFVKGAPRHIRRVQLLGEVPLNNPHLIYEK